MTTLGKGSYHTCAVLGPEQIKCWGANDDGELGIGNFVDLGLLPGHMGDNLKPVSFSEN